MKILLMIDSLGSGGAQRQLVNLAIEFKKRNHNVDILSYYNDNFFMSVLTKYDINTISIKANNNFFRFFEIRRVVRNGAYNSVLSFLMGPNLFNELSGLPHKSWSIIVSERSANPEMQKSIKFFFFRIFHLFADALVSNSYSNVKMIIHTNKLLDAKKIHVIRNMIDLEVWKPINDFHDFRKDNKLKMIIPASHHALKNLQGLINALIILDKDLKEKIIIEWYGEKRDNSFNVVSERIKEYHLQSVIKFYPPTPNIMQIIQEADCVGLFSFYEGFPNVICEAMACGKPVVVSCISDIPQIVYENENGFLCDPTDNQSIANALHKLINSSNSELQKIGLKNRRKAEELFDQNRIVDKYLKLLKNE